MWRSGSIKQHKPALHFRFFLQYVASCAASSTADWHCSSVVDSFAFLERWSDRLWPEQGAAAVRDQTHRSVLLTGQRSVSLHSTALTVLSGMSSMSVSFSDCLFLLLGDELWWYLSGAAGISCVATCLSSYRSCLTADYIQSAIDLNVSFPLCPLPPHMREAVPGDLQAMRPVLIIFRVGINKVWEWGI